MLDALVGWLGDQSGLTPHGFCLSWQPGLIWLHGVSDMTIGFAYFTIPLALAFLVSRRPDLVHKPVIVLFGAFILLCGTGHWLDVLTLWVPVYGLEGTVKAATAAVSLLTAAAVWTLMPKALLQPSAAQLLQVSEALSDRERQGRELSRVNADLEQFVYIASHDLKAPLQAIARLAGWISADIESIADPETLENLHLIQQRADRLQMLIGSLLSFARVGHGRAAVEAVNVGELVTEITGSIAPPPAFRVRFNGERTVVLTQRSPLEHVLRNLISNAIAHHDHDTGEVIVSASITDDTAEFRVEDDGPGIAPRFHEQIFKIFQTLQSRDETDTSGVGLSIVQKLVEQAGGRVWIESAPPRRGTAFFFTWPQPVILQRDAKAA